jgi:hypothetical protein
MSYPTHPTEKQLRREAKLRGLEGVFEMGREFEAEQRRAVKAATQRMAIVNQALNKKLAEGPEGDGNG